MDHGPGDERAIVTSTWELSLDTLAAHGRPQARPILRVLSCLAPAVVIPSALLDLAILSRACPSPGADQAADGLAALASAGLITTQPGPPGTRLLDAIVKRPTFCYQLPAAEHVGSLTLDRLRPGAAHAPPAPLLNPPAPPRLRRGLPD